MGRGRPAKPTKLKLLAGNPGKRPLNDREPKPRAEMPSCPKWLDDEAKAKWKQLAGELAELGLLTIVDGDALAAYCQAWAEFKEATRILRKEGRTTKAESGYTMPHPAVAMQRSAMDRLRHYGSLFGLDPSSRSKLSTGRKGNERDPFEDLLRGKRA